MIRNVIVYIFQEQNSVLSTNLNPTFVHHFLKHDNFALAKDSLV